MAVVVWLCLYANSDSSTPSHIAYVCQTTYHLKAGDNALAWRLVCVASRACLDLGYHRLVRTVKSYEQKAAVFWHIYAWDQALAFGHGRAPTIHYHDITTESDFNAGLQGNIGKRSVC